MSKQLWEHTIINALEVDGGVDHVVDGLSAEGWELVTMAPLVLVSNDIDCRAAVSGKGLETFTRVHSWKLVFKRRIE